MRDGDEFLAQHLRERPTSVMSEAGDLGLSRTDVINFSLGDPDLTTDERIIDAMCTDARAGHTHYTETLGQVEFREEIVAFTKEHYGLDYALDECMVTTSANHGMWLICQALANPGDEILLMEPYFTPYLDQVSMSGAVPVPVPTQPQNGFLPTEAELRAAISERTRAIIVNSPANPTGAVWDRETLEMTLRIAEECDLLILADDIYTIYDYERPFVSIATLPGAVERTVILNSFSKNYCMAGFRIGYLLGPRALIAACRDLNESVVFTPPSISQRAGLAALRLHDEVCPPIREVFRRRLAVVAEEVNRTPKMSTPPPRGAIYLWVDIRETGLSSIEVARRLFAEAGVAVVAGPGFGESGEGYIRLACTISEERSREAFARIRQMPLFRED
ncbi:MAG: aminotransferase class I/II-fold pyridoxal phosphate-dependent enzyme [Bowdeniella nasicola]|nr:aminotransferase class I/II-fold pyridoxal phosphate-dependent enzyme [Bowdeniella nasicola]